MDTTQLISLAKGLATQEGVPPDLVCAICEQESNWNTRAARYEPGFLWTHESVAISKKLSMSVATAQNLQKFSFGLMQIMWVTAMDLHFDGHPFDLLNPEIGIVWGARLLAQKMKTYPGDHGYIAAYNSGRPMRLQSGEYINHEYVASVLRKMGKYAG
jgi:soluble lytic murein transglycosylase-like protein